MATALDFVRWYDPLLLIGSLGGLFWLAGEFNDWWVNYEGTPGPEAFSGSYRESDTVSLFQPKKVITLDTRGVNDISTLAGTAPKTGLWGGKNAALHDSDQTALESLVLFNRSAKFHPWTTLHKREIREKVFQQAYSARLHH